MKLSIKIPAFLIFCVLTACSDSGTATEEKQTSTEDTIKTDDTITASPHSIQGMKKVMGDARSVEDMLQKNADEQRREIDSIR
ncbi:MAG: hypothetical protein RQ982_12495 [Gammaproteobacteria bacterium]|nr:hypothetical protein [Gammaproteobacteria bacterium]